MLIDEELTLKKLEIFLAFMRSGNLARAAVELETRDRKSTRLNSSHDQISYALFFF